MTKTSRKFSINVRSTFPKYIDLIVSWGALLHTILLNWPHIRIPVRVSVCTKLSEKKQIEKYCRNWTCIQFVFNLKTFVFNYSRNWKPLIDSLIFVSLLIVENCIVLSARFSVSVCPALSIFVKPCWPY